MGRGKSWNLFPIDDGLVKAELADLKVKTLQTSMTDELRRERQSRRYCSMICGTRSARRRSKSRAVVIRSEGREDELFANRARTEPTT